MFHHICILIERGGERGKKMRGRGGGRGAKTGEGGENMWCTYDDVAINIPRQDVDVSSGEMEQHCTPHLRF